MSTITDPTLVDAAIRTARRWATTSGNRPDPFATRILSDALHQPGGLEFMLDFVDGVVRPEDSKVAARNLARLAERDTSFMPAWLRNTFIAGARTAPKLPGVVIPQVRAAFIKMVGDLVVDVDDRSLGKVLAKSRRDGVRLNINLLGEAVLGEGHARRRLDATRRLLARDDVDYVSLKVSAVLGPHAPFALEQTITEAVDRLRPLYLYAAESGKFINLDMEEYKDLNLTREVFMRLLDEPALKQLYAGIVVQTYLPDALGELATLQDYARRRVETGGAPIKVRLVKGANLAMEAAGAAIHEWPSPILPSKQASDANFLRCLEYCLRSEHVPHVRVGVASHNLFSQAMAWELAKVRRVTDSIDVEMLSGMATAQAEAIRAEVGALLLYLPVVDRAEYDAAISYLVRRLEENAAEENFMSRIATIGEPDSFTVEATRFRQALDQVEREDDRPLSPNRTQDRTVEPEQLRGPFRNTPDTDPAILANQRWAAGIIASLPCPDLGRDTVEKATLRQESELAKTISRGVTAGRKWAKRPLDERIELLHRVGDELEKARADLIRVAADEVGKAIEQADVEVSEACDFAHYYAEQARLLSDIDGASFAPAHLTLITPPWNFPLAIPLGGVMAALAAGSAVILKPASPSRRCGALLAEACWRAGIDPELLQLVAIDDRSLGQKLVTDPQIEKVVLTGAAETAQLFMGWRPDLDLMAETSGKNAIIVTESADLDLAVADVVASAFGHAGQKCSAASLVILVGSVGKSQRFRDQLVDAVTSLRVDWPTDPTAQMGPLTEQPGEKLLRGLTTLEGSESWLVTPRTLDDSGRLWSPGVREGVRPGSDFHLTEFFGPILGIMHARDLDQAIAWQNATAYGLTAGLHSLDVEEINHWVDNVAAGNCYVNRTITGAIVRRQPFGGWKRSVVGTGAKAGGPNYLFGFGWFSDASPTRALPEVTTPALDELLEIGDALLEKTEERQWLKAAIASDELAMSEEFSALHDPSGLGVELNILRYRPAAITLRLEQQPLQVILRELSPALASRVPRGSLRISVDQAPECITDLCKKHDLKLVVESAVEFDTWASHQDWGYDGRIRYVSSRPLTIGSIDVAVYDGATVSAGRVALLPYLHEQSVSITNHRFGNPSRMELNLR